MKFFSLCLFLCAGALLSHSGQSIVQRVVITPAATPSSAVRYLAVEVLDDDLVHFEVSGSRQPPKTLTTKGIYTSPMIDRLDYPGPKSFSDKSDGESRVITTDKLRVVVDLDTLSATVVDITRTPELVLSTYHYDMRHGKKSLYFSKEFTRNVYGLGEHFMGPLGSTEGDFAGASFTLATNAFGNAAFGLYDESSKWVGMSELANFPIFYSLGHGLDNYAMFLDNIYAKEWFFEHDPYRVTMYGNQVRWYVLQGENVQQLRSSYMELIGRTPVPPKRFFGMWNSVFGYHNWAHIDHDLKSLTRPADDFHRFPVDGIGMDIYWFGGGFYEAASVEEAAKSTMGDLFWDTQRFPDPRSNVDRLKNEGVGMLLIEESYLSVGTKGFKAMNDRGYLAKDCATCGTSLFGYNGENHWWGVGGMIDWSNKDATSFWFNCKHCPLILGCEVNATECADALHDARNPTSMQSDITGFWLDLGEPEMFHDWAYYKGWVEDDGTEHHQHGDYHNLHNLYWAQSIAEGFARKKLQKRPWFLCRSGASGVNRYGTSLWSGDIWPDLRNMASSIQLQKHMTMVGIDYFGSDVGGFQRKFFNHNQDEKFTQWFANSAWFDVPFRPHTWQDNPSLQTAPSQVGHLISNLFNSRQRYELTPYYYSLAHLAYRFGTPVVAPLFYYFQEDLSIRRAGHEQMIGSSLLVAVSASEGQRSRNVYLPGGTWVNYHTNQFTEAANGTWVSHVPQLINRPQYCNGNDACIFVLPAFVRVPAILPRMRVDQYTKNTLGQRWKTDTIGNDLVVGVYVGCFDGPSSSEFVLFEDDGETIAYRDQNAVRTTRISQKVSSNNIIVTVDPSQGNYANAPSERQVEIQVVHPNASSVKSVSVNGVAVKLASSLASLSQAQSGYFISGNQIIAKSASIGVQQPKTFVITGVMSC